jgi:hypothetical protein
MYPIHHMSKNTDPVVTLLAQYFKEEQPMARHAIEQKLPKGLLNFALCLNYNNAAKCVADFRKHHDARLSR